MDSMKPATADFSSAVIGLNHLLNSGFKALRCQP
tara:strand:+ start:289 stop:390 length:102 start_codon:yes stop_codon:yes gene_type:complete